MYLVKLKIVEHCLLVEKTDAKAWLWRRRMCHQSAHTLHDMVRGNHAIRLPHSSKFVHKCSCCLPRNMREPHFPKQLNFKSPRIGLCWHLQTNLVAYDPRRHQGMTLRRRRSRHPRASSPLDRRRRRMPTFTTLSEDFISPPQTSSGSRARGFIVLPFPLFRTFVARTCLSGPLHIFLSLF